jgi:hypothetical protein
VSISAIRTFGFFSLPRVEAVVYRDLYLYTLVCRLLESRQKRRLIVVHNLVPVKQVGNSKDNGKLILLLQFPVRTGKPSLDLLGRELLLQVRQGLFTDAIKRDACAHGCLRISKRRRREAAPLGRFISESGPIMVRGSN